MRQPITQQIIARIYGGGRGNAFTTKDFLDLAGQKTTNSTLDRLTKNGTIRRLARGVYEYPSYSALLKGPASPDPDAVARAMARAHGWTIMPSGNTALNLLGLSTQVPANWEYFSDGPSKNYKWSGGTLTFKHRANKDTTILSPKTALLVQALKTLGEENVKKSTLTALRKRLTEKDRKRAVREARYATSWVYEIVKRLAKEKESSRA